MGIFAKLKKILGLDKKRDMIKITVVCNKCSHEIDSVFRKNYDFQPTYGSENYDYSISKKLVCPSCYSSINLYLELDNNLEILKQEITDGEIIDSEE